MAKRQVNIYIHHVLLCHHCISIPWLNIHETAMICIYGQPPSHVLRVASGPRVKLASCKSALNPKVVYSIDRSKAVVPVLVLLLVAL